MISLLRKNRKSFIEIGSARRYTLYAFGEIVLVVVGILIALQINNWNQDRINRSTEIKLLNQLVGNLKINEERLIESIGIENRCSQSASIITNHLDLRLPYHDSLGQHFAYAHFSGDVVLTSSAFEAIKSKGFEIIKNDELRSSIIELFDAEYESMLRGSIELEDQFWPTLVLPLQNKHFRLEPKKNDRSKSIISYPNLRRGWIPKNYEKLLNDDEYVSMIEYRGMFRDASILMKEESLAKTRKVVQQITIEIKKG